MSIFDQDFLLQSPTAKELYSSVKDLDIIDYHSHLSPKDIYENKPFYNLTELWLAGDHYKWRYMRNNGIAEQYITGNATDEEKFLAFCKAISNSIGNAIYTWCHMELKKYFDITLPLNEKNAMVIYNATKEKMKDGSFTPMKFFTTSKVVLACTTDDPIDSLEYHQLIAEKKLSCKIVPTFRPDKALNINLNTFNEYINLLTNKQNPTIVEIKNALAQKLQYFVKNGCFVTDHALDNYIFEMCDEKTANEILSKVYNGKSLTEREIESYKTHLLVFLAQQYTQYNVAMQLHYCCKRNNNGKMFDILGADTGFDSINSSANTYKLADFFDYLQGKNALPKTIVYSLDPNDDKLINTVINCFQAEGVRGKIQHGSAWWFNDSHQGIKNHLTTLAEYSVLGSFIGMLTDSRSFSSYVRHDYFRRILCNLLAEFYNNGEYLDKEYLHKIAQNISLYNTKEYFDIT